MIENRRISGFHSSGKWLLTDTAAFQRNVRKMRQAHTFGTRTEATDGSFNAVLNWPENGWGQHHERGWDCSVEWDKAEWHPLDGGLLRLTDIQIRTEKGHLQPPVSMPWTLLENKHNGGQLIAGGAHLDLDNTALRRKANLEECRTLNEWLTHTRHHFAISLDGNRDQRRAANRRYFQREMLAGTGGRSGWLTLPKNGGTHGKRAILDLTVSDLHGKNVLLVDDPSSDHRPISWLGLLPGARQS